jgi:hypothetical protein
MHSITGYKITVGRLGLSFCFPEVEKSKTSQFQKKKKQTKNKKQNKNNPPLQAANQEAAPPPSLSQPHNQEL